MTEAKSVTPLSAGVAGWLVALAEKIGDAVEYMNGIGWAPGQVDLNLAWQWLESVGAMVLVAIGFVKAWIWGQAKVATPSVVQQPKVVYVDRPVSDGRPQFDDYDLGDFDDPVEVPEPQAPRIEIDMDRLYENLKRDEGVRHVTYNDKLGYLTAGVGHRVLPSDIEYSMPVGTKVGHEQVIEWFRDDVDQALSNVIRLFPDFNEYPMEVRLVLTEMIFQLGYVGLSEFKKTRAFIEQRDWAAAADEMMDSLWAEQTPNRAQSHSDRLKSIPRTTFA